MIGEAATGGEAITLAQTLVPDVIVMDFALPDMTGVAACRVILAAQPQLRVLFLSMHEEEAYFIQALRAGAVGYLIKRSAAADIREAVLGTGTRRGLSGPDAGDGASAPGHPGRYGRLPPIRWPPLRRANARCCNGSRRGKPMQSSRSTWASASKRCKRIAATSWTSSNYATRPISCALPSIMASSPTNRRESRRAAPIS